MKIFKLFIFIAVLFYSVEGHTSKYTGPKSADVQSKVEKVLRDQSEADGVATVQWNNHLEADEILIMTKLTQILKYDPNGWNSDKTKFVPQEIFVSAPKNSVKVGDLVEIHLDFSPRYEGRSITGVIIKPKINKIR